MLEANAAKDHFAVVGLVPAATDVLPDEVSWRLTPLVAQGPPTVLLSWYCNANQRPEGHRVLFWPEVPLLTGQPHGFTVRSP